MTVEKRSLPIWILIVSGFFALLEMAGSALLFFSPEEALDTVDLAAKGVDYVINMWAIRQFALGFIFAFATLKKSIPMLILAYVFFLVMFTGDVVIGLWQQEPVMIISSAVMCLISVAMLVVMNKRKNQVGQ
jgi:hypothetical protein